MLNYYVVWSEEDQSYIGLCDEIPVASFIGKTKRQALSGIKRVVNGIMEETFEE